MRNLLLVALAFGLAALLWYFLHLQLLATIHYKIAGEVRYAQVV